MRTIVNGSGSAKLAVTTTAATGTGTLTVSDGTNTGTTVVTQIAANRRRWFAALGPPEDREPVPPPGPVVPLAETEPGNTEVGFEVLYPLPAYPMFPSVRSRGRTELPR